MKSLFLALVLCGVFNLTASAAPETPYAGQESRDIKALSPEDVEALLAGKGMGFAKAAELNGYPGPAHVLELADKLQLQTEQRSRTQAIFQRMESSAKTYGAQLVEAERKLELLFRNRQVNTGTLLAAVEQITDLQAQVRVAHLQAHIEQAEVLTPQQMLTYSELRGYRGQNHGHSGHSHKHQ